MPNNSKIGIRSSRFQKGSNAWDYRKRLSVAERIFCKFIEIDGCWIWTAGMFGPGYGAFDHRNAHVVAYELLVNFVPTGKELDHLCRNRACINPEHLEPVTHAENIRRGGPATKTHCVNGHLLSGYNLYIRKDNGRRGCRACRRQAARRFYYATA